MESKAFTASLTVIVMIVLLAGTYLIVSSFNSESKTYTNIVVTNNSEALAQINGSVNWIVDYLKENNQTGNNDNVTVIPVPEPNPPVVPVPDPEPEPPVPAPLPTNNSNTTNPVVPIPGPIIVENTTVGLSN